MSVQLKRRLDKLEARYGGGLPHVVKWSAGENFDDALARSPCPRDADGRLLIYIQSVEGGHGKPVTPVPLSPEQQAERDKAKAWAAG